MRVSLRSAKNLLFQKSALPFVVRLHLKLKDIFFWVVLIVGLILGDRLSHLALVESAAIGFNDQLLQRAAQRLPIRATNVRVVAITPADFSHYFSSFVPYSPVALQKSLCGILRGHPRLLIVDLDTSHKVFAKMALPKTWIPIVWGRSVRFDRANPSELIPDEVLGGQLLRPPHFHGLAVDIGDPDWSIRAYPRWIDTRNQAKVDTLHWAALKAIGASVTNGQDEGFLEVPVFDRYFDFDTFPLDDFYAQNDADLPSCLNSDGSFPQNSILADARVSGKIVVLGGEYSTNDLHRTSLGARYGVEMWHPQLNTSWRHPDPWR
jgi:hypothetical protein